MANLLGYLLNLLSQNRPIVIAALCVAIVIVLFRPRPKPVTAEGQQGQTSGAASSSAATRRRSVAISTDGILLRFVNGRPRVIPEMVKPLQDLAAQAAAPRSRRRPIALHLLSAPPFGAALAGRCLSDHAAPRGHRRPREGDARRAQRGQPVRRGQVRRAEGALLLHGGWARSDGAANPPDDPHRQLGQGAAVHRAARAG